MKKFSLTFFVFLNLLCFNVAVQAQCSTVTVATFQPSVGNYKLRATIPYPYYQDIEIMGSITPEGESETGYELTIYAGNLTGETDQTWIQNYPPTFSSPNYVSTCIPNGADFDSLTHIFTSLDQSILQSTDSSLVEAYLKGVNYQIKQYLTQKYPQYLPFDSVDVNDPETILFGIVFAFLEATDFEQPVDTLDEIAHLFLRNDIQLLNSSQPSFASFQNNLFNSNKPFTSHLSLGKDFWIKENIYRSTIVQGNFNIPTWLRCIVDVSLGYFNIVALINDLGTFEFGTVWRVVKTVIKKYVGWIGAAILLYDIGTQCL